MKFFEKITPEEKKSLVDTSDKGSSDIITDIGNKIDGSSISEINLMTKSSFISLLGLTCLLTLGGYAGCQHQKKATQQIPKSQTESPTHTEEDIIGYHIDRGTYQQDIKTTLQSDSLTSALPKTEEIPSPYVR